LTRKPSVPGAFVRRFHFNRQQWLLKGLEPINNQEAMDLTSKKLSY
jgi:hypothetical protein